MIYNLKKKHNNIFEKQNKNNNIDKIRKNESIIVNNNKNNEINIDYKESDNLSEIADDIVDILKEKNLKQENKNEKIENKTNKEGNTPIKISNKKTSHKDKNFIPKKKINIKKAKKILNNNYINKTEYSISNLLEIFYKSNNKISNKTNINNNSKEKEELIVEHVFDYYHYDNNDDINKNIKLFNKENSLSRNIIKNNKKEKELKEKNNEDNKEKMINDKDRLNSDDRYDEEGEKIINSLIAQASQNKQNEKYEQNNVKKEYDKDYGYEIKNIKDKNKNILDKKTNNKNQNKKVSFDENLIFINYNQNNKVINFNVTNQNNRLIHFKSIDISKYLKILKNNSEINKLKPVILNTSKIDVDDIVNKIKKKEENKKNKTNNIISLKNKITQRNIDFIKIVQKRGTVYNISKEKAKKKTDSKKYKKFSDNPQNIFTEELCDNVHLSYNLEPKNKSRSTSSKKNNDKNNKKIKINEQ